MDDEELRHRLEQIEREIKLRPKGDFGTDWFMFILIILLLRSCTH